jgi:hypothetical protein
VAPAQSHHSFLLSLTATAAATAAGELERRVAAQLAPVNSAAADRSGGVRTARVSTAIKAIRAITLLRATRATGATRSIRPARSRAGPDARAAPFEFESALVAPIGLDRLALALPLSFLPHQHGRRPCASCRHTVPISIHTPDAHEMF